MTNTTSQFEPNPLWVLSLRELSQTRAPARYLVRPSDKEPFEVVLKDRKRQVVDTMIKTEVFCASTVRIGDVIFRMKEDDGLFAETKKLSNGRKYYTLNGTVKLIAPVASGGES